MNQKTRLLSVFGLILFTACSQKRISTEAQDDQYAISADRLKQHIAVLSSDSFMGRKPFTRGETKTVAYLQKEFAEAGLEGANEGSFLQEVPMVSINATAATSMRVFAASGNFSLKAFDDYVIWTDKTDPEVSLDQSDLVFAGYGVVAPEYNWNDYADIDVRGKVVMVMVNDPGYWVGDSTLFKGKTMTYYGRWTYKFDEAARQGAKGCLIIHNTAAAGYPFFVPQNNFNTSRLSLDNRGKEIQRSDIIGWVPESVANRLFKAAGFDASLFLKANQPGFKAVPLNLKLSTTLKVKSIYSKSSNVIGQIRGSKRPDETLIYTSHWDHLGIGKPDATGDSIYNGALDNASGTAGLLEMARAFSSLQAKPERTVVFLALTAEEQGLLGSEYYAQNPVYPIAKTVANINIDGMNPFEATKDIVVIGKGQSELEDYLKQEVERSGGYISDDLHPEAGIYFRSDHFNFAKMGIPALFTKSGIDVISKGREFGQKRELEFILKKYHRPSDEFDPATWTVEGAITDLKLLFRLGKRLAGKDVWPQWKQGSEFKATREIGGSE